MPSAGFRVREEEVDRGQAEEMAGCCTLINLGEYEVSAEAVAEAIITSKVLRERLAELGIQVKVCEHAGAVALKEEEEVAVEEEEERRQQGGEEAETALCGESVSEKGDTADDVVTPPCTVDVNLDGQGNAMALRREHSPMPDTPPMPAALRALGAHAGLEKVGTATGGVLTSDVQEDVHTPPGKDAVQSLGNSCMLPLPSTPVMQPPTTVKKKSAAEEEASHYNGTVHMSGKAISILPDEPGAPSPFRTPGVSLKKLSVRKAAFFGDGSTRSVHSPAMGFMSPLGSPMTAGSNQDKLPTDVDFDFAAAEAEAAAFAADDGHGDENDAGGGSVARTLVMSSAKRQNQVFVKSSSTRKSRLRPRDADARTSL